VVIGYSKESANVTVVCKRSGLSIIGCRKPRSWLSLAKRICGRPLESRRVLASKSCCRVVHVHGFGEPRQVGGDARVETRQAAVGAAASGRNEADDGPTTRTVGALHQRTARVAAAGVGAAAPPVAGAQLRVEQRERRRLLQGGAVDGAPALLLTPHRNGGVHQRVADRSAHVLGAPTWSKDPEFVSFILYHQFLPSSMKLAVSFCITHTPLRDAYLIEQGKPTPCRHTAKAINFEVVAG